MDLIKTIRNLFQKRASSSLPFPFGFGAGGSSFSNWGFRNYVQEGFYKNPMVFACLDEKQRAANAMTIKLEVDGQILEPHEVPARLLPLQRLIVKPNPNESIKSFLTKWIYHIGLAGISYVQVSGAGFRENFEGDNESNSNIQLWLIQPDKVSKIKVINEREVIGYEILGKQVIDTNVMHHIRYVDPAHDFNGMPPLKPASRPVDSLNKALEYNDNLLSNFGVPSGLLGVKGLLNLTDEKRRKILNDFHNRYGGPGNAGKTAAIAAEGFTYTELSKSSQDLQWLGGLGVMNRYICNVFGVPSQLFGDPDTSKFSNYKEARKALFVETAIPDVNLLLEELNTWMIPQITPENARYVLDSSMVDVLKEDKDALFTRVAQANSWSENEKRIATGQEEKPGGDVILKPFNLVPLESLIDDNFNEDNNSNSDNNSRSLPLDKISKLSRYKTEEDRLDKFDSIEKLRAKHRKLWVKAIKQIFKKQMNLILGDLDNAKRSKPNIILTRSVADILKNHEDDFIEALESLQINLVLEFGQAAIDELLLSGVLFDIERPMIQEFLATDLFIRSQLINMETSRRIQKVINIAVSQGLGNPQIAERIRNSFSNISKFRSVAIARTETLRAESMAMLEGWEQSGIVKMKEWVSARGPTPLGNPVRDTHNVETGMDGQIVDLEDDFISSSGASGPGPGLMGIAEEDINCRCTMAPLNPGDKPV